MRADGWTLRTWILAAIAGLSVLVLLLALAGMGARLPTSAPEDPAPLPSTASLPSADIGLQSREAYAAIAQRPLFSDNRQPQPFFIEGQGPAEGGGAFNFVLTSVLLAGQTRLAILQPPEGGSSVRFKLGESAEAYPDWRLVTLSARSATFEGPEGVRTLDLRVFDGKGGERATQLQQFQGNGENASAQQAERRQPAANAPQQAPVPALSGQTANTRPPQPPANTPTPGAPANNAPTPSDEQVQAIRARIQQRRAELRREQQSSGNGQ
ncbi:general secretion pathway protein GspN [Pseudoxanthomonas composti]|uniref:General secretion pathway protein GspN n=1 Tax=Pseudoxanthomonas composti TaxID=2137479 RepID=A0A4Q1JRY4_9GAMM|nr:general secretion pathway protein GspN [Pseudoxanthomonas composti]RXR01391.1 general secretion pathway protein GspN [Pseudoxanthomonas composti]